MSYREPLVRSSLGSRIYVMATGRVRTTPDVSNAVSNVRRHIGPEDDGPVNITGAADLHERGPGRTEPNETTPLYPPS